ncbi:MAG: DUF4261 domain-containing protein [Sedimentisphaerales bacterium]|nr:DUF4261 domain-containing protein [Sedimentisphaerales bacterium]
MKLLVVLIVLIAAVVIGLMVSNREGRNKPESKGNSALAFLALNGPERIIKGSLADYLKAALGPDITLGEVEESEETVVGDMNGYHFAIGKMDFPIPWGDLEGPCATAWMWPEATAVMEKHTAHLIVAVLGEKETKMERVVLVTHLMAGCIQAYDAAGVYWGDGTVVHEPQAFLDMAKKASVDDPPVMLWCEFRVQKNVDGTMNIITTGLDAFGRMEIEILESRRDFDDLMTLATGTAWILLKGEVIADGDTIGSDTQMKIKTSHEKSVWDRPGKVLRIYY